MSDQNEQLDLGLEQINPKLKEIPLADIRPNLSSGDSVIESSVGALGLLSVPVLQPSPGDLEYRYRIVDGRRRIEAARKGEREAIDAYVIPPDVGAEADAVTFLLNLARSPSPLREAEALSDLVDSGYTPEALSRLGPSLSTIKKRLRLASAPEPIKNGVREGEIAEGVAEDVANLSPNLQDRCVKHYRDEGELRHKDVKQIRTADRNEEADTLPESLFESDTDPEDVGDSLEEANTPEDNSHSDHALRAELRAAVNDALSKGISEGEVFRIVRETIRETISG